MRCDYYHWKFTIIANRTNGTEGNRTCGKWTAKKGRIFQHPIQRLWLLLWSLLLFPLQFTIPLDNFFARIIVKYDRVNSEEHARV